MIANLIPVHAGHLDIQQDERGHWLGFHQLQGFCAPGGDTDFELIPEDGLGDVNVGRSIVHQ